MQTSEDGPSATSTEACLPCKVRHRKCNWDPRGCSQCNDLKIKCVRPPALKIRHHILEKTLPSASSEIWRQCPVSQMPLQFYDETQETRAIYEQAGPPSPPHSDLATGLSHENPHSAEQSREDAQWSLAAQDTPLWITSIGTADSVRDAVSLASPPDELTTLSPIEALLVRNFASCMAQWTDVADPNRTFETTVSCLAFTNPIIRYAICAFSARHYYRLLDAEDGDEKALDYQNRCYNLLIPSMSGGHEITDTVMTAVALLRQNEEMDEQDNRWHLEGAARILNMVPEFATMGGVGEAACWLCLREDIYIALTRQTMIKTGLDCFLESSAIRRGDDHSWASQSILNLAFLLKRAFCEPRSLSDLALSRDELAEWEMLRPISYRPIYFKAQSRGENRCFPDVWMLLPYHAVGLQYFHIAQLILSAIGQQQTVIFTGEHLAESRARERQIRYRLYMVLGIAMSNRTAENTWFTARHCVAVWGAYIKHPDDQNAVLEFLELWRQRSGWKTSVLVESLRRQWYQHDDEY